MAHRILLRLANAVVLFFMFLFPLMLLIGVGEGTEARPGILFWMLLLLPLLILPWLWSRAPADAETAEAPRTDLSLEALAAAAAPVVDVERTHIQNGVPIAEGRLRGGAAEAFQQLERALAPNATPLLESSGGDRVRILALPTVLDAALRRRSAVWVNVLLFVATMATTVFAGALHRGVNVLETPSQVAVGLPYAAALLAILGVHEMGHFVVARWHGVDVTWPYFIPVPMGLGTLGAFIQIKSLIKSRRVVFDIGVAGPLAGLLVAVPALYFGLQDAEPVTGRGMHGVHTGSSVLLALLYQLANGGSLADASSTMVRLSPLALAGWIGLFITALNLLPVGQLDGGHIAYALFGRRHARTVGIASVLLMAVLGLTVWPGLLTWALLIALIGGFAHMPALNDVTAPDGKRYALGAVAHVLLVLIMAPLPGGAMRGMMLDCPYM
jgi:membrane-associated protease RseP (regulator of RpoE activity)